MEEREKQGSRVRGALGALLGAFLAGLLCVLLVQAFSEEIGELPVLGGIFLEGWMACWGYRLFRGHRSMRFAQWTVRVGVLLGLFAALVAGITLTVIWLRYGTLRIHGDTLYMILSQVAAYVLTGEAAVRFGLWGLACLWGSRVSWGVLLKYVDPDGYDDPRRLAQAGGGGDAFNRVPSWPLPPARDIPERFEVDKGKLTVEGENITVRRIGKPLQIFSVHDVAGVVLGVPNGYNILCDRNNKALARFAWSRKNALLFGQYLAAHQVPFRAINGEEIPAEQPQRGIPTRFVVRLPEWYPGIGWFVILLCYGAAVFFFFLVGSDPMGLLLVGIFLLVGSPGVYMLMEYRNWRLEADGTQILYRTAFRKETQFYMDEIEEVKLRRVLGVWELRDREGKRLARFDFYMENADMMIAYLKEYQTKKKGLIL